MDEHKSNIGIVTMPISRAGLPPLQQLVKVISVRANSIFLITGDAGFDYFKQCPGVHLYGVVHKLGSHIITRIFRYIITQFKISLKVWKLCSQVHFFVFSTGGTSLFLPVVTAKLFRKKAILIITNWEVSYDNKLLSIPLVLLNNLNLLMFDRIIVYDEILIQQGNLKNFQSKINVAPRHFLDFNKFMICKPLVDRKKLIGYMGRFKPEKGVLNFIRAVPKILDKVPDLRFIMIGEGPQVQEVKEYININGLGDKVLIMEWIDHDLLPKYLNEISLLVLPSYAEQLPNIVLEAMACGTPVLATPVGAVPSIIKDGLTGFIMENNSPECISVNVVRVSNHTDLDLIIKNAHDLVINKYNFETISQRYESIFAKLRSDNQ